MKLVSWNVNGLRSIVTKGFADFFTEVKADVFCVQETKMQPYQLTLDLPGYHQFFNSAIKKGYSGTAVFTKKHPLNVNLGIKNIDNNTEGRVITLEFEHVYVVNVYTPNSKRDLSRLTYRMQWEDEFCNYLLILNQKKPVIICGDLNVAHQEIDLKNPKSNTKNAGFTNEEREKINTLLNKGFTDTFRYLNPNARGAYTWWSYMNKARENNSGWRIDYFLVSKELNYKIKETHIYSQVLGSDHCPIGLTIDLP